MINKGISNMIVLLLAASMLPAQTSMPQSQTDIFKNMPGEKVYVHYNSGLLFAGETLYYKLYCRNTSNNRHSSLSKIGYIALVDRDHEPVFMQKLRLQDGSGQGDFFVPADIPSGSYKLVAYTQWMKNRNGAPVFLSDIMIINPYQNTPEEHLEKTVPDSLAFDSIPLKPTGIPASAKSSTRNGTPSFTAVLNKEVYRKREKVELELNTESIDARGGHYSLSVRRIPDIGHPPQLDPFTFEVIAGTTVPAEVRQGEVFLPELRGELISGKVVGAGDSQPAGNIPLALSLSGDEFIFDMARTNGEGRFYFNIDLEYQNTDGIFQVLNAEEREYDILPDQHILPLPESLEFYDFKLDSQLEQDIRSRSIWNQIENAYQEVKADTLIRREQKLPFYRNFQLKYALDDFTRFNTIEETLVEIVDHIWLVRNAQGDPRFQVRPFDGYLDGIGLPPMVFIDGLYIQNHSDIVSYPARQIKNIFISRDRYQIGANIFQGILAFETFSSDFSETFSRDFLKLQPLFKPEPMKAYFFQEYNGSKDKEQIPDYRQQLYWNPHLEIIGANSRIHWYTSDLPGAFEIRMEGYTVAGKPVALYKIFNVE